MLYSPYSRSGQTAFPQLRAVVRPDLAGLPDRQLTDAVAAELGADAQEIEDFLSSLRDFGSAVGQRLPSIVQGGLTGLQAGSVAGPYGALAGLLGGAVVGGLTAPTPGRPPAPQAAAPPQPVAAPRAPAGGPAAPPSGGAAAGLMGVLANPSVQQALAQMVMGRTGGEQVTLPSGTRVPVPAFAELIREVADQVLAEYTAEHASNGAGEDVPEYLREAGRRDRSAIDDPVLRAALLLRVLEPPAQLVPVTPVQPVTAPSGPVAAPPPPGAAPTSPSAPQPAGPFISYGPPDLGAQGPTRYSIDQSERAWARALADWEFDEALSDIFGTQEPA